MTDENDFVSYAEQVLKDTQGIRSLEALQAETMRIAWNEWSAGKLRNKPLLNEYTFKRLNALKQDPQLAIQPDDWDGVVNWLIRLAKHNSPQVRWCLDIAEERIRREEQG